MIQETTLKISDAEHQARCDLLQAHLAKVDCSGVVIFSRDYILYYAGFAFIPTERPIAFVMNAEGERAMFVPRMEVEHAQANALIDRVDHYIEYPDVPHPMVKLEAMLQDMGITGKVAADNDGYPHIFGYRGKRLSEFAEVSQVVYVDGAIEDQMAIKSDAEINLLRISSQWANLALRLLQTYTVVGATETAVAQRATHEASTTMMATIGSIYKAQSWQKAGASTHYRGQIGRNAAIPHALSNNIIFQKGDVLIGEAGAYVWGYTSELERTMIIGQPTDAQKTMFDHMLALQDLAFEAIKPGESCSTVDQAVRAYYEKHDLQPNWRHHTGHAIGMRYHEGPFLDIGDETIIQPGMVFTVEPGLYADELGGFRHSDTVVVTEDGIEIITYYPRSLSDLTLPV